MMEMDRVRESGSASIYILLLTTMVSILSLTYLAMINNSYLKSNEVIAREKARIAAESGVLTVQKMIHVLKNQSVPVTVNSTVLGWLSCQLSNQNFVNKVCVNGTGMSGPESIFKFSYPNSTVEYQFDGSKNLFTAKGNVWFSGLSTNGFRESQMKVFFERSATNLNFLANEEDPVSGEGVISDGKKLIYTHANQTAFGSNGEVFKYFESCNELGCTYRNAVAGPNVQFEANPAPAAQYTEQPFHNMFDTRFNELFNQKPSINYDPWTPARTSNPSNCTVSLTPDSFTDGQYQELGTNDWVKVKNGFSTDCNIDLWFNFSDKSLKVNGDLISGGHITVKNSMTKKFWVTGNMMAGGNITSQSGMTINTTGFNIDGNFVAGGNIRMAFQTRLNVGGTMSSKGTIVFSRAVDNGVYIGGTNDNVKGHLVAQSGIDFGVNSGTDPVKGLYVNGNVIVKNGNFRAIGELHGMWIKGDLYVPNGNVEFHNAIFSGGNQAYQAGNGNNNYLKSDIEGSILAQNMVLYNDKSIQSLLVKKSVYLEQSFLSPYVNQFTVGGNLLAKQNVNVSKGVYSSGIKVGTLPALNTDHGYLLANQSMTINENAGLVYAKMIAGSRNQPVNFGKSIAASSSSLSAPLTGYIFGGIWSGGQTNTPPLMDAQFKKPVLLINSGVSTPTPAPAVTPTPPPVNGTIYDVQIIN